ncbi:hypothetical protein C5O18_08745 [Amnimonas aquatica]|uniref:Uncharacterized protein n=2 Tax=Amnimonas aquatica TaxID=2094561 RepID=A0A2P6AQY5_9GAMM|nr:hypothetical protein C5O18_08745 [Amnimonas aquatica]
MDAADPRLEGGTDPLYDQLRGEAATAVTEIPVTQNSAHPLAGAGLLRDLALPLSHAIPWLRRQMAETVSGRKQSWL